MSLRFSCTWVSRDETDGAGRGVVSAWVLMGRTGESSEEPQRTGREGWDMQGRA